MRAPLARVEVTGPAALVDAAAAAADDLRRAGHVQGDLVFTPSADATEISVVAELAEAERTDSSAVCRVLPRAASQTNRRSRPACGERRRVAVRRARIGA